MAAGLLGASLLLAPPAEASDYTEVADPLQSWSANRTVYDVLTVGDRVYIGGTFSNVRNPVTGQRVSRDRLAAFDRLTGALLPWNPGANDTVRSLSASPSGDVVYAGGLFTTAGGTSNQRIAALDAASGDSLPGFTASASDWAREVAFVGDSLYAAGAFKTVNGVARRAVVKLDGATGAVDEGFNARVGTARVFALADSGDGRLVLGGNFQGLSGSSQRYLAAVSPTTGAVASWNPTAICDGCTILDVAVEDGVAYTAVGGPGGGRGAAWTLDVDQRKWSRGADGDVQAVDVEGAFVYFGGHFGPAFFNQPAHQLVSLSTNNGTLQDWHVPFVGTDKPGIWAVEASADRLRIGGAFQGIGTSGTAARYAALLVGP